MNYIQKGMKTGKILITDAVSRKCLFRSFLQRGVEWWEDLVEVSWLGINGGLGPGGLDRWEAVRNLDPQSRLVASQSGQQSARWSNQVGEHQTTRRLQSTHVRERY